MGQHTDPYQQDYFQRVRRRTLAVQSMAPLSLLAVALADSALTGTALWSGARAVTLPAGIAALGLLMAALARVKSIPAHGWLTIAMLCAAELSLAFIVTPTPQAVGWIMPILLAIPLAAAPFWIWHTRATACCLLCYACASTALYRAGVDQATAVVFVIQAALLTCVCLAIFHSIDRLRRSAYAFQMDLDHEAKHDALTGLLSRRRFLALAEAAAQAAAARGECYALCFIDLDRFKDINDRHGHAAGDRALSRTAELLLESMPADGMAARMGGEEFVALLPAADVGTAQAFAESLRLAVQAQEMPGFTLTLSAGIACRQAGEGLKQTLQRADRALLAAKQGGRNRVVTAPDVPAA